MKPQGQRLVHLQFAVSFRELVLVDKLKLVAKQRDGFLRAQFSCDVAMYKPEVLIFLDEMGSDKRNTLRKYGYSLRGKPAISQKLLVRGKSVSATAFMWCA